MQMLTGVLAPNITIFDSSGRIDLLSTEKHMRWMIEKGVQGFFLTGSYGSGFLLSLEEKVEIYRIATKLKGEYSIQLIAQIGSMNTKDTIECGQRAYDLGIEKLASITPLYYTYTELDILNYYEEIVKNTHGDIYVYNNPKTSNFRFKFDFVKQLQSIGIKGMKDSSLDIEFISSVFYDKVMNDLDFDISIGTSTGWLSYQEMGILSMIAGMCNYAPEIIVNMYKASISGDKDNAVKYYSIMMDLNRKIKKVDSVVLSTSAISVRGFKEAYPRKPLQPMDDRQIDNLKIDDLFRKYQLIS